MLSVHFFGEVTLASTAHEQTTLVTLVSYKHNVAKHGSAKLLIDQWAVTTRNAN